MKESGSCQKYGCQKSNLAELIEKQDCYIKEIEGKLAKKEKEHLVLFNKVERLLHGIEGCSNHDCPLKVQGGMGTNSSCQCHRDHERMKLVLNRIRELRDEIRSKNNEAGQYETAS